MKTPKDDDARLLTKGHKPAGSGALTEDGRRVFEALQAARGAMDIPRLRRVAFAVVFVLLALGPVLWWTLDSLVHSRPGWWDAQDYSTAEAQRLAGDVERGALQLLHRGRAPGELWSVFVREEEANTWLNARMPLLLAWKGSPLPEIIEELRMRFADGAVTLGGQLRRGDSTVWVAATVEPVVRDDRSMWVRISAPRAGRLDLPTGWTVEELRRWIAKSEDDDSRVDDLLSALAFKAPLLPDATFKLVDGRRVRIVGIDAVQGRLTLTCETLAHGAAGTGPGTGTPAGR